MANSVAPDQTAPIGAVCSVSTLFASMLNSPVMLGNYSQRTTSADDIFRCIFFLGALWIKRTIRSLFKQFKFRNYLNAPVINLLTLPIVLLVDKASVSGAGGRRFDSQYRRHWGSF